MVMMPRVAACKENDEDTVEESSDYDNDDNDDDNTPCIFVHHPISSAIHARGPWLQHLSIALKYSRLWIWGLKNQIILGKTIHNFK